MMSPTTQTIVIRNGRRAGHIFLIVAKLGFGLACIGLAAFKTWTGGTHGQLVFLWITGAALTMFGLHHLQTALDQTAQVTMTNEGSKDRRTGGNLIPWNAVERLVYQPGIGNATASFEFELRSEAPQIRDLHKNRLRVQIDELDTNAEEFVAHVRRFAPHLEVVHPLGRQL
jgi:hypothetical protein